MESIGPASATEISEAIVIWTGWGHENRPVRDELRVVDHMGSERAADLMPIVRRLEDEFYESDARYTVADIAEMGERAASRFRTLHPELTRDAIEALSWCYTYDFK